MGAFLKLLRPKFEAESGGWVLGEGTGSLIHPSRDPGEWGSVVDSPAGLGRGPTAKAF